MRFTAVCLAAWLFAACLPAADKPLNGAPQVSDMSAVIPNKEPFEETANADEALEAALSAAKTNGTRVLVKFGGNWCGECQILAGMFALPELDDFIDTHFELVTVDIGRYDTNMHLTGRLGLKEIKAVPTLVILEADGNIIDAASVYDWSKGKKRHPQQVANHLAKHVATQ